MDPKVEVPPVPEEQQPKDEAPVEVVEKVTAEADRAEAAAEMAGEADAHVTKVAADVKATVEASAEILEESHKVLAEAQAVRDTQPQDAPDMMAAAAPLPVEDPFDVNYRVVSQGRAASKQIKAQLKSNDAERLRFLEQHERERVAFEENHANQQAMLNTQLAEAEGSMLTAAHMLNRILEEIIGGRPLPVKDPEGLS